MLQVVFEERGDKVSLGVADAAESHYLRMLNTKGTQWVIDNGYTKDHALMDFMCVNYAWLEFEGQKLVKEEECCQMQDCCPVQNCCQDSEICVDGALSHLLAKIQDDGNTAQDTSHYALAFSLLAGATDILCDDDECA